MSKKRTLILIIATHYKKFVETVSNAVCIKSLVRIPAQFKDMYLFTVEFSYQDVFI